MESKSDTDCPVERIERYETALLKHSGLPLESIQRLYVTIEMDGAPFRMRTFIIDKESSPTLVLTHGYACGSPMHFPILKALSEEFRVVMFDNMSFGANTRLQASSMQKGGEAADTWLVEHVHKWIEAMGHELPRKFYLAGHSRGGYLTGLYASQHPERIDKLFMISPSGLAHIPDDKLDIYSIRTDDSRDPPSKDKVEHLLKAHQEGKSYMEAAKSMPFEAAQSAVAKVYAKSFADLTSEMHQDLANYFVATHQHDGVLEGASLLSFKYKGVAKHPLVFDNRLGNKDLEFAIGVAYGDRDWLCSEDGAEPIIMGNKYFSSGDSQLFRVPNSGHMIFMDNPRELERQMIGFFTGKLEGIFDPTPRDSYVAKL